MGPAALTLYQIGTNGAFATTVAGTQVTFDGIPAPLIYTKSTQVSVMVPYELAGRVSTAMVVSYNGVPSTPLQLRVVDSAPGIYTINQTGTGQGAILNQNGTVNGTNSPEVSGDVIQIYATGEGQTSPAGVDGGITPGRLPVPAPILPVTVQIGGIEVPSTDITYAGEAPGLISGVLQVNARIPAGVGTGPVSVIIRVGGTPSQPGVTVTVR
jgi:trimeric autotransporter adhesin